MTGNVALADLRITL